MKMSKNIQTKTTTGTCDQKHNENLPGMGGIYNTVNLHLYHSRVSGSEAIASFKPIIR